MTLLENPDENPCFGCGPHHARGLRLNFERGDDAQGAFVRSTHTPKEDEIGWPGLFHTGLHFMTLFEACYWGAWELTGKVHVAHGPQTFDQQRLPRVGKPFVVTARLVAPGRMRAESHTPDGKPLAALDAGFRTESRARMEKAGLGLPAYILDDMEP